MSILSKPIAPAVAAGAVAYGFYRLKQHVDEMRAKGDKRTLAESLGLPKLPLIQGNSLVTALVIAAAVQGGAFVVANHLVTEKFYDSSGAATFFIAFLYTLLAQEELPNERQLLVNAMGSVWATRLGVYLLGRILHMGGDFRFKKIKTDPKRFFYMFWMQFQWIAFVGSPIYILNGVKPSEQPAEGSTLDKIGRYTWLVGFLMTWAADHAKYMHKLSNPPNVPGPLTGLFALCRQPNYFGETLTWLGMYMACAAGFNKDWMHAAAISPLFTYHILARLSIPNQTRDALKRYGSHPGFKEYIEKTPAFFPKFF